MPTAIIPLGKIFLLFSSACLHFGSCESRWRQICHVCIRVKKLEENWSIFLNCNCYWIAWLVILVKKRFDPRPKSVSSSLKLQFLKIGRYIVALIWQWRIGISAPLLSFAIYQTHVHHIYIAWGSLIRVLFLNCFSLWRPPSVECHLLLSQQ